MIPTSQVVIVFKGADDPHPTVEHTIGKHDDKQYAVRWCVEHQTAVMFCNGPRFGEWQKKPGRGQPVSFTTVDESGDLGWIREHYGRFYPR